MGTGIVRRLRGLGCGLVVLVSAGLASAQQPGSPLAWPASPLDGLRPAALAQPLPQSAPPVEAPTAPTGPPAPGGSVGPSGEPFGGSGSSTRPAANPGFGSEKNITVNLGGRVQLDAVDYVLPATLRANIPGTNPLIDGVSFRRLRLDASGTIYKHTDYLVQVDFVNAIVPGPGASVRTTDVAVPTDAWVTFKDLPVVGNIRVGNHKPWYSFEHLTSSRFLNFLERSIGFDAFAEGFNNGFEPGISAFDTYLDKRGTWGIGLFKNIRSVFAYDVGRNELDLNGRVTFLPVYADDGKYLVHLGVGASHRDPDDGQVRFRARFDARNSPSALSALAADTGLFNASQQHLLVPEFAAVWGPLSIQSEYYASWASNAQATINNALVPQGTVFFESAYAEAHLFLTGEHREYNRNAGVFDRVKPLRPVDWSRCGFTAWGAWQLTARYSYLDLNDKAIVGGRVNDLNLGLNWFLNQYMKVQWNYFLTDRNVAGTLGDGKIQGFATRLAWDF